MDEEKYKRYRDYFEHTDAKKAGYFFWGWLQEISEEDLEEYERKKKNENK